MTQVHIVTLDGKIQGVYDTHDSAGRYIASLVGWEEHAEDLDIEAYDVQSFDGTSAPYSVYIFRDGTIRNCEVDAYISFHLGIEQDDPPRTLLQRGKTFSRSRLKVQVWAENAERAQYIANQCRLQYIDGKRWPEDET